MNTKRRKFHHLYSSGGFTLIELLTVVAIIGILAAILIPTVGAAKNSAKKAKTRVQFNQWGSAMSLFKQEYGYYPTIGTANKVTSALFAGALTGANLAGVKYTLTTDPNLCGNKRILSFYSIADSDLSDDKTQLVDAFGNTDIGVAVDSDGDGLISGTGTENLAAVGPIDNPSVTATPTLPTGGIRAGVVFYSAGKGGVSATEVKSNLITSW